MNIHMPHLNKIVSSGKLVNGANYARRSHLHCVQNLIVTRGYSIFSILICCVLRWGETLRLPSPLKHGYHNVSLDFHDNFK